MRAKFRLNRNETGAKLAKRKISMLCILSFSLLPTQFISLFIYCRRPIVNPAFAKRSVDSTVMKRISISEMHNAQKRDYLQHLDDAAIDFHRQGRKDLYEKLEKFFDALGWHGNECVLRLLCEMGKTKRNLKQGSFLEEIMRVTFTLPPGREFETNQHKQYDEAHGTYGDCEKIYPSCGDIYGFQLYEQ